MRPRTILGIAAYVAAIALLLKAQPMGDDPAESSRSFFFAMAAYLTIMVVREYFFPANVGTEKSPETPENAIDKPETPGRNTRSPWMVLIFSSAIAFAPVTVLVNYWQADAPVTASAAAWILCGWALSALTFGLFWISPPADRSPRAAAWWLPCMGFIGVSLAAVRLPPELAAVVLQEPLLVDPEETRYLLLAPLAAICWRSARLFRSAKR